MSLPVIRWVLLAFAAVGLLLLLRAWQAFVAFVILVVWCTWAARLARRGGLSRRYVRQRSRPRVDQA